MIDTIKTFIRASYFYISNAIIFFINFRRYGLKPTNKIVFTYNPYHFGDNAIDMLLLTKASYLHPGYKFNHFCKKQYICDLQNYVSNFNNINIYPLCERPWYAINTWKNYMGRWERFKNKNDFVEYYKFHFNHLINRFGFESYRFKSSDLIFNSEFLIDRNHSYDEYDFLIVNSIPLSKQFIDRENSIDALAVELSKKYKVITTKKITDVSCTSDYGLSLYQIGCLSKSCKNLLMISTGPSWFCINNETIKNAFSISLILDSEFINLSEKVRTINAVPKIEEFDI